MRITKPTNWKYLSPKEKESWAVDMGKKIEEARQKFRELARQQADKKSDINF